MAARLSYLDVIAPRHRFVTGACCASCAHDQPCESTCQDFAIKVGAEGVTDAEAREYLRAAFVKLIGIEPTLAEMQLVQGVARFEGGKYGSGWKGAGAGSNNWGAIQSRSAKPPDCDENSFLHGDKHQDGTPYQWCYRKYESPQAGAEALLHEVYVRRPSVLQAANLGDLIAFSTAMKKTSYYAGKGTDEQAIAGHVKIVGDQIKKIAKALDEPIAVSGLSGTKQVDGTGEEKPSGWPLAAFAGGGIALFMLLPRLIR